MKRTTDGAPGIIQVRTNQGALHPGMRAIPVALLRPISRETDEKDALCHSA